MRGNQTGRCVDPRHGDFEEKWTMKTSTFVGVSNIICLNREGGQGFFNTAPEKRGEVRRGSAKE
jgi:hypothetical protein